MPKPPNGKARLDVYIDERLYKKLRELARQKYENFRGALSNEVEEAIRHWILLHAQSAHKSYGKLNPEPKVFRAFRQVKEYMVKRFGYEYLGSGQQFPKKHIVEAIAAVRGADEKTINKWMKRFINAKLIKHIAGEVWEIT
ncbi:MAG: hypothetical protein QE164_02565 [Candidatus Nezhaarchaeota archaeon]|nr:hypothetical protein [Candidatus Nezhaarchaeota archaeon]